MSANFCARCGKPRLAGYRFCGSCGFEVERPSAAEAVAPARVPDITPLTGPGAGSATGDSPGAIPIASPIPSATPGVGPTLAGTDRPMVASAAAAAPVTARIGSGRGLAIAGVVGMVVIVVVIGGFAVLGGGSNGVGRKDAPGSSQAAASVGATAAASPSARLTPRPTPVADTGQLSIDGPYELSPISLSTIDDIESGARGTGYLTEFDANDVQLGGATVGHVVRITLNPATPQAITDSFVEGLIDGIGATTTTETMDGVEVHLVESGSPGWAFIIIDRVIYTVATFDGPSIRPVARAIVGALN